MKAASVFGKRLKRVLVRAPTPAPQQPDLASLILPAQRVSARLRSGAHRRARKGDGQDFWQYRQALPHEPFRHIDWRQSARSQELWVREREAEAPQTLAIWCDSSASMAWHAAPHLPAKRVVATLSALALAASTLSGGEDVTLMTPGAPGRFFRGRNALTSLTQSLVAAPSSSCPRAEDAPPGAEILLVSDFMWTIDAVANVLQKLAPVMHRVNLLCVLDPAEENIPYRGRLKLIAPDGTDPHLTFIDERLARRYSDAMQRHLEQLRLYVAGHGGSLTVIRTTDDLSVTLQPLHARLAGKSRQQTR